MLLVISPAKKLDFDNLAICEQFSQPNFLKHSQALIDVLKEKNADEIKSLMKLSDNLADLNVERYKHWQLPFTPQNAKQAISAFKGDVYTGLNIESFNDDQIQFTQQHLRILSGLYGVLRPLDLIQPYRLEMGTALKTSGGKNLYEFWQNTLTDSLNQQLELLNSQYLINLASNEYWKSIKQSHIKASVITPEFKELKTDKDGNTSYRVLGLYAKRARGMMSAFILKNKLQDVEQIKQFNSAGYQFNPTLSKGNHWVFSRDKVPG